jgi:hypothetical protein
LEVSIVHRAGKEHGNADYLSRLPVFCDDKEEFPHPSCVLLLVESPHANHLSAALIAEATKADPVLSIVVD